MEVRVKLSNDDLSKLQGLFYAIDSRGNLFERLMTGEKGEQLNGFVNDFMTEYEKIYKEYTEFKLFVEEKYKPEDIKTTAKRWYADFAAGEIVFEV